MFATLWSCNDSTLIGDNVVIDSSLVVDFNDQATIKVRPILSTETEVSFPLDACRLPNTSYLTNHSDETFGKLESQIYAQFTLAQTSILPENFETGTVDSVNLRLAYGASFKGDTSQQIEIEIYKVTEPVNFQDDYLITQTIATELDPIGSLTFSPRPTSPRELYSHKLDGEATIDTVEAFESIRLPDQIGWDFLNIDSSILVNDTMLRDQEMTTFNIRTKGTVDPILSYNLFSSGTRLEVHYKLDTTFRILPMSVLVNSVNYGQVTHDSSTGTVGANIGSYAYGDTLVTVDALAGVESEITISDINLESNVVINSAYLELVSTSYTEDLLFTPAPQLVLYVLDENGERVLTTSGGIIDCAVSTALDGRREFHIDKDGVRQHRYRLNIANEVQELILDNSINSLTFILSTFQNISSPTALKAYGPQSPISPMTLKISYTEF